MLTVPKMSTIVNSDARVSIILVLICMISIITEYDYFYEAYSLGLRPPESEEEPFLNDPDLKIEQVVDGLQLPTKMVFIAHNDILVLEKETGTVKRIVNGTLLEKPLLDLNVATKVDRGLLGVSFSKNSDGTEYVFLYYTETRSKDREDIIDGKYPLGNRLYRYELENNKLVHPTLLLDLPVSPNRHPGGQIQIGTDKDVYITIGDLDHNTKAQNNKTGQEPDGTSGILRITQDGEPVGSGILGDSFPLNLYYAYGIRNSFGIDFDPVTGKLWDTENGPEYGDEINLVEPGFNSGWKEAQGIWVDIDDRNKKAWSEAHGVWYDHEKGNIIVNSDDLNLVDFNGKGKYSEPELTWDSPVGVTALKFLKSDKLGKQYENDLFVGDFNDGYLYHFDLNGKRTELHLNGPLRDKVVNQPNELKENIFGHIFGGISDIEVGPDGYLYVISIGQGKIFRIIPS